MEAFLEISAHSDIPVAGGEQTLTSLVVHIIIIVFTQAPVRIRIERFRVFVWFHLHLVVSPP
ncbi:hypothetical protein D3C81_1179500 [compost metagenome]